MTDDDLYALMVHDPGRAADLIEERTAKPTGRHLWVSNRAFTALTGIKRVCLVCGQPDPGADRVCPGKRPEREVQESAREYVVVPPEVPPK
jgi:hypothetical protein